MDKEKEILMEVGGIITALGITQTELARRTGIKPSTLSLRLKHPGDMRLNELWAIRRVAKRGGL